MRDDLARTELTRLERLFSDEDTETWRRAAVEIGRRAARDPNALAFLLAELRRRPKAGRRVEGAGPDGRGPSPAASPGSNRSDGDADGSNIHRFRHACCALASYVSEPEADRAPVSDILDREIALPLAAFCLDFLKREGTIEDLDALPGLSEEFSQWRAEQEKKLAALVDRFEKEGNRSALEANRAKLEELRNLRPDSPVPRAFGPRGGGARGDGADRGWILASYFAGVRARRALLGLSLAPVVRSLLDAGIGRGSAGLSLAIGLPKLLAGVEAETGPEEWKEATGPLFERFTPAWASEPDHHNNYCLDLAGLTGAPQFLDLWLRGVRSAEWLRAGIDSIAEAVSSEASPEEGQRLCARLLRRITAEYFGEDDWKWAELTDGERFSLNVFCLLVNHGPEVLARGRTGGHDGGTRSESERVLEHLIELTLDALAAARSMRVAVLPDLVRCLKILLHREILLHAGKERLAAICRRQLLMVRPLVADWRLARTLRKDIATIVVRILHVACEDRQVDLPRLFYVFMYAPPDDLVLREMEEFTTSGKVRGVLRSVRDLTAAIDSPGGRGGAGGAEGSGNAGGEMLIERYDRYAASLEQACSAEDATGMGRTTGWIRDLCGVVRAIVRRNEGAASGSDGLSERSSESLLNIFRFAQVGRESWRSVLLPGLTDQDRAGALAEESDRERRWELAARALLRKVQLLLEDISVLESSCLPEAGRVRVGENLARQWRSLIARLGDLERFCAEELPHVEREVTSRLIRDRVDALTRRLRYVLKIVEGEDEGLAGRVLAEGLSGVGAPSFVPDPQDARIVQEWMIRRYMIAELARGYGLRVLSLLASPLFVFGWIAAPFAACLVLFRAGQGMWCGFPFLLTATAGLGLVIAYFAEFRRRLGSREAVLSSSGRLLLPQVTAALFLGVTQIITIDESWTLAIDANPIVRSVLWVAFLAAGFFFIREALLGDQLRKGKVGGRERKKKSRRTLSVMALGLWQSYTLVLIFCATAGKIMSGPTRADINVNRLSGLAREIGNWIPNEVPLTPWSLPQEGIAESAYFKVFPWALISWTVQAFFVSAILDRIMQRGGD